MADQSQYDIKGLSWLMPTRTPFRLSDEFLASYRDKVPKFGFNGLGEFVYYRTYSRRRGDGTLETWADTVERVVNGTFDMQKEWIESRRLTWDEARQRAAAERMFDNIFEMRFLPPGRGLWAMGTAITSERRLYAALNNCSFVSTRAVTGESPALPYTFLMDMSMLGVGVGFDTAGAVDGYTVRGADRSKEERMIIPDTREGWVQSVEKLINAHILGLALPTFDYSLIRPIGAPIRGFGGIASGPGPLIELHEALDRVLESRRGLPVDERTIVDMMNMIGKCVVSGNVRHTAEIAFGSPDSDEFLDLKNYEKNPERAEYGWTSNNTVFAHTGMDYAPVCKRVALNGEPGFFWLDNARAFGRMGDPRNDRDARAQGGNPCLEQTLESFELCCLVETFPERHETLEEFLATLESAYLYAKTVTLGVTHWEQSNSVMLRNRRIGTSLSGIAQFVARRGIEELRRWCEAGYAAVQQFDERISEWLTIPRSIKTTSIKPSGTVSLLAGATPGMHYPESRFCIRRVRVARDSGLVECLERAGYPVEPAESDPTRTAVAEFPIDNGPGVRSVREVSMWEQLSLAAFLQRHWSDNQVSSTVTFDPEREGRDLPRALDLFQYQLKGVSFLPILPEGAYRQMPLQAITEEEYRERTARLSPIRFPLRRDERAEIEKSVPDKFCDNDSCTL